MAFDQTDPRHNDKRIYTKKRQQKQQTGEQNSRAIFCSFNVYNNKYNVVLFINCSKLPKIIRTVHVFNIVILARKHCSC